MATRSGLVCPELCYDCCTDGYCGDCRHAKVHRDQVTQDATIDVPDSVTPDSADSDASVDSAEVTDSGPVKVYFTYDDIHRIIIASESQLKAINPDYIIAIGGGGLIPARMVRTILKIPILVVTINFYDEHDRVNPEAVTPQWLTPEQLTNLADKTCLIVDEINDTAATLDLVVKRLRREGVTKLSATVIHHKIKARTVDPILDTYVPMQTIPDKWIVYPWETENLAEHNKLAANKPTSFTRALSATK